MSVPRLHNRMLSLMLFGLSFEHRWHWYTACMLCYHLLLEGGMGKREAISRELRKGAHELSAPPGNYPPALLAKVPPETFALLTQTREVIRKITTTCVPPSPRVNKNFFFTHVAQKKSVFRCSFLKPCLAIGSPR